MGMIFAQTVADNARAFLMRLVRRDAQLVEREENTALDGFKAVLHARKRTLENDMLGVRNHGDVHDLFHGALNNLVLRLAFPGRLSALSPACHYFTFPSLTRNVSTLLKSA